jgi:hypothetical protein
MKKSCFCHGNVRNSGQQNGSGTPRYNFLANKDLATDNYPLSFDQY